jgi:hypothetical protein
MVSFPLSSFSLLSSLSNRLANFINAEKAFLAISKLDASELHGRRLHFRLDHEQEDAQQDADDAAAAENGEGLEGGGSASIFIGNLPWSITEAQLETSFDAYHPISCRIVRNMSGKSRGFALMKFAKEVDALAAIAAMNQTELIGRIIEVIIIFLPFDY